MYNSSLISTFLINNSSWFILYTTRPDWVVEECTDTGVSKNEQEHTVKRTTYWCDQQQPVDYTR